MAELDFLAIGDEFGRHCGRVFGNLGSTKVQIELNDVDAYFDIDYPDR